MSAMEQSMNHNAFNLSGAITVAAVVVIFFSSVFFLILYLRSNLYLGAEHAIENSQTHFAGGTRSSAFRCALHPAVLKSLPVAVFSSVDFKDGVDCAVCISQLTDGELFRYLPGCRHYFHLECIDLWFSSNSTCPVCRSRVESPKEVNLNNEEQSCSVNARFLQADCSGEGSSNRPSEFQVEIQINAIESSVFSLQSSDIPAAEEVKSPPLGRWDAEQGLPPPPAEVARIEVGEEISSS